MEENDNKSKIIYKIIMLVLITAFVTFILTTVVLYKIFVKDDGGSVKFITISSSEGDSELIKSLKEIKGIVDEKYLGEIDEKKLKDGVLAGYISGLGDKYSEYFTKEEMEDFKTSVTGNYKGIGIYMTVNEEKNLIEVLSPIKESPAEKAGIQPGDLITKVDGVEYTGKQLSQAANYIKGEAGTTVKLEILRNDKKNEVEVIRTEVHLNPIESKIVDEKNKIGYIIISSFDENTGNEFRQKYEELKNKGIEKLIIDLRNNGGGLVTEALQIAEYIVDKDSTLLITKDKNNKEVVEKSKNNPIINMAIVILTNEHTASASEILAGALRDNNKATIIGTKTYGKGVIQQLLSFGDGSGLKLTIEEYYTPNNTKINQIGIQPDIEVKLPDSIKNKISISEGEDTQLQKAIEELKK